MKQRIKSWIGAGLFILGAGVLGSACATAPYLPREGTLAPFSILQGPTGPHRTRVALQLPREGRWGVHLVERETGKEMKGHRLPLPRLGPYLDKTPWMMEQYEFSGLEPKRPYDLRVSNASGEVVDRRTVYSLDPTQKKIKWVAASCMDDFYEKEQGPIWRQVMDEKPDFLLLMGDNVYADSKIDFYKGPATPDILWTRYHETRRMLEIFRAETLIPTWATWDDHDYGKNDGDAAYPYGNQSAAIFYSFFPQEKPLGKMLQRGPGVASSFSAFGQTFVITDGRSFRTKKSHWGPQQDRWIEGILKKGRGPLWLVNGDQFFGGYSPFESFEGRQPQDFKRQLKVWAQSPHGLIFLSGDRHLFEVMGIEKEILGYPTFEITTSAIHAKTFRESWDQYPNPRRLGGAGGEMNYGVIESETMGDDGVKFSITGKGTEGRVLFRGTYEVSHPRKN